MSPVDQNESMNTRKSSKQSKNNQKSSISDKKWSLRAITINRLVYPLVYLFSKNSTERVLGKYLSQISDFEVKTNGESRKNTQNDQRWSETVEIRQKSISVDPKLWVIIMKISVKNPKSKNSCHSLNIGRSEPNEDSIFGSVTCHAWYACF